MLIASPSGELKKGFRVDGLLTAGCPGQDFIIIPGSDNHGKPAAVSTEITIFAAEAGFGCGNPGPRI